MSRPVVVFPVNDRPHYLSRTLASWSRVRGVGEAVLVFVAEPGCPEVARLCGEVTFGYRQYLLHNRVRAGVDGNPRRAFGFGFELGDYVVQAEEDDLVSTDVLEYFGWCGERYRDDPGVFAVCAFQPWGLSFRPAEVYRDPEFRPTVCALWERSWELVSVWDFTVEAGGWDNYFQRQVAEGRCVIKPIQSRSQHIGVHGAKGHPGRVIQAASFVADVAPQQYVEVG